MTDDDVLAGDQPRPTGSPTMMQIRPNLGPERAPLPLVPALRSRSSQSDAVIVSFMGGGLYHRYQDVASRAGERPLPTSDSDDDFSPVDHPPRCSSPRPPRPFRSTRPAPLAPVDARLERKPESKPESKPDGQPDSKPDRKPDASTAKPSMQPERGGSGILQALAGSALAAIGTAVAVSAAERPGPGAGTTARVRAPPPPRLVSSGSPACPEEPPTSAVSAASPFSSASLFSPSRAMPPRLARIDAPSPAAMPDGPGELPPLQLPSPNGPDSAGPQQLPSLRFQLGFIDSLPDPDDPPQPFAPSPPGPPPYLPMSGPHVSPPVSPVGAYRRDPPPHQIVTTSNLFSARPGPEYPSTPADTPSTDQSASTPAAAAAAATATAMTLVNGANTPSEASAATPATYFCGFYQCSNPGPFHTQYLLSSHMTVHSQTRPHFCPVSGCPRAEGGKGFKRKNEMIRHGLVHDSPGYMCPFCPGREHRYPRPDNLQRHVRVHHGDMSKDDPRLRRVLAQRADGANRGRRRNNRVSPTVSVPGISARERQAMVSR